jgi:hypothetical protein
MTPLELAEHSLALITRILEEAYERASEGDLRAAFIYRHTRNICDLGEDILVLELENRSSAARIVIRSMLESLFRLVAAVKEADYASEKLIAELEDEVERIRNWIAVDRYFDFGDEMRETIEGLADYAEKLRREYKVASQKRWSVFDTAKIAELDWQYARDYFLYSKYVHATISGIISQEYQIGRGHILQTTIFTVLEAVGHAVQIIETATPQAHIDEATRLMGIGIDLVNQGAFRDVVVDD